MTHAALPELHVYLDVNPQTQTLSTLRTRDQTTARYFSARTTGTTPAEQDLDALLITLQSVPYRHTVQLHTARSSLRTLLRTKIGLWPDQLKHHLGEHAQKLHLAHTDPHDVWLLLLPTLTAPSPNLSPAENVLHVYTQVLHDGVSGVVQTMICGEGTVKLHHQPLPDADLAHAELHGCLWAIDTVPTGKSLKLYHRHPQLQRFWKDGAYLKLYSVLEDLATTMAKTIEEKQLQIEFVLPEQAAPGVHRHALRVLASQHLGP